MIMRLVCAATLFSASIADAVGEGGVAGESDDVLVAAGHVARDGHAERGGERGACVAGAEAVVLAFGAEHEAVEAAGLADGVEARARGR